MSRSQHRSPQTVLTAQEARRWQTFGTALVIFALAAWALKHALTMVAELSGRKHQFELIYIGSFLLLAWHFVLYTVERPIKLSARRQRQADEFKVAIIVPVYNEDPELLERGLRSFLAQTRLPQVVYVVDDGSDKVEYGDLPDRMRQSFASHQVEFTWERKLNGGKRSAQAVAIHATPDVDVYVTVDSDSVVDPHGIGNIIKPLAFADTHSVGGMVLCLNNTGNLLARFTDLWWVTQQMVTRSSLSTLGSVMVNSGAFAAYRAQTVRKNLGSYLHETFAGRHVPFSDDSLLTLYCVNEGRAVQQPNAYAFTAMPTNISHHLRQYVRWMRGSFIRSIWRFRYLPLNRYVYWIHLCNWCLTAISTVVVVVLFVIGPAVTHHWSWALLLFPILIGFGQSTRYMMIKRSDQSVWSQLLTYATVPIAWLWAFSVLRAVRWYGIFTCCKMGWGTRQKGVEVGLNQAAA